MIYICLGLPADSLCTKTYNMVMLSSTRFPARLLGAVHSKRPQTP